MTTPATTDDVLPVKPEPQNWLDPLNRIIWQAAFKTRATLMTLRDGRKFRIRYEPGKDREGKPVTMAWVQIDGWVSNAPCGWFVREKVLDPMWIRDIASEMKKTGGNE